MGTARPVGSRKGSDTAQRAPIAKFFSHERSREKITNSDASQQSFSLSQALTALFVAGPNFNQKRSSTGEQQWHRDRCMDPALVLIGAIFVAAAVALWTASEWKRRK